MNNFTYYTPTKVVFGKGTENQVGALIEGQQARKVMIHFGVPEEVVFWIVLKHHYRKLGSNMCFWAE